MTAARTSRPCNVPRTSLPVVCQQFPETPGERKQHRTKYSGDQRNALEAVYNGEMYPSTTFKRELAMVLDLTNKQVQIWFQNRRSKWKHDMAAAGLPLPSRRAVQSNGTQRTPLSSPLERSYSDGALCHPHHTSTSGYPIASISSVDLTALAPFPFSSPWALAYPIHDDQPAEQMSSSVSSTYPEHSSASLLPPAEITPKSSSQPFPTLQRHYSMPSPMSMAPVRPVARRSTTSNVTSMTRPSLHSFQPFTAAHRLSYSQDMRPSTSSGGSRSEAVPQAVRPGTSAGLVRIPSVDGQPSISRTPNGLHSQLLASPITIRGRVPIPQADLGPPPSSPTEFFGPPSFSSSNTPEGTSPAPSVWSSSGSWSSAGYELDMYQSTPVPSSVPRTPPQSSASLPSSHFAPFSPTGSFDVSPTGSVSAQAFDAFFYGPECAYNPSMDEYASLLGGVPAATLYYPPSEDFTAMSNAPNSSTDYHPVNDLNAGFASSFAAIGIVDADNLQPAFTMHAREIAVIPCGKH